MTDRKKVIEALRGCSEDTPAMCKGCPFYKLSSGCINDLMRAALELIEGGQQESGNGDFVSRQYLLAEYDRQHQGPPGGARKIIAEAPAADAVPVIRCRDCKNRDEEDGFCTGRGWPCQLAPDDGFCDKGKKK